MWLTVVKKKNYVTDFKQKVSWIIHMLASPWSLDMLWFHFSLGHQTKICFKMFHSGIWSPSGIWQSFRRNYFKFGRETCTETFPTLTQIKNSRNHEGQRKMWGERERETQITEWYINHLWSQVTWLCSPERVCLHVNLKVIRQTHPSFHMMTGEIHLPQTRKTETAAKKERQK